MSLSTTVTQAWTAYCCEHAGAPLPITKIEHINGLFVTAYECEETDDPLTLRDGTIIRRLALGFDLQGQASWS